MAESNQSSDEKNMGLKILVADDHALVRGGLSLMIDMASPGAEVVEANSYDQAMKILSSGDSVDLMLMDLMMPGMNGEAGVKHICESWPEIPVVIVSVKEDIDSIRRSLSAGAMGYIPKTSEPNVTVSAIKLVLEGGIYVPPHVLHAQTNPKESTNSSDESASDSPLSRRQMEVMDLIESGKSNKAIASELGLSTGTVKMHVSAIFKKLSVASRTEAVAVYSKLRS